MLREQAVVAAEKVRDRISASSIQHFYLFRRGKTSSKNKWELSVVTEAPPDST